jgi:hypothetical protein
MKKADSRKKLADTKFIDLMKDVFYSENKILLLQVFSNIWGHTQSDLKRPKEAKT